MIRLAGTRERLVAVDLDDTLADHTGAFRDMLEREGVKAGRGTPTSTDYVCDGWFDSKDSVEACHERAVLLGLYLREEPLPGALDALDRLNGSHPLWHVLLTSDRAPRGRYRRDADRDTARWLLAHDIRGIDLNWALDDGRTLTAYDFAREVGTRAKSGQWGWDDFISHARIAYTPDLDADLYVDDDPQVCDELLDMGRPLLIRRLPWNRSQCERAERSGGRAFAFDGWDEVPDLAARLLGEDR